MTPRERMFCAIDQLPVDRLPVCTYNCHPFAGSMHVKDAGYAPILAAIRQTQAGCLCKVRYRRLGSSSLTVRSWMDKSDTYHETTWQTPLGPLTRLDRTPDGQPSLCVKAFVSDDGDIEKFFSTKIEVADCDVTPAVMMAREIGENGLAYIPYGDPFYRVAELFDPEDLAIQTATDMDRLHQMVDFAFLQVQRDLTCLLDALKLFDEPFLFFTVGPELATPPMMSPTVFRDLVVPYQKQLVDMIHACNYRVSLHCHGRVREVFPYVLQCGFDAIEPLEPPPQGNIGLDELYTEAEDQIALMGYVQDQDFYLLAEEDIRNWVRTICDQMVGKKGYLCCPTCTPFQFPPSAQYVKNYVAFLEAAEEFGGCDM